MLENCRIRSSLQRNRDQDSSSVFLEIEKKTLRQENYTRWRLRIAFKGQLVAIQPDIPREHTQKFKRVLIKTFLQIFEDQSRHRMNKIETQSHIHVQPKHLKQNCKGKEDGPQTHFLHRNKDKLDYNEYLCEIDFVRVGKMSC
ncbi:hypothetical protein ACOSP7_015300 [Xanthoceras sorbifolium]